jgi:hypothetical protein
MIREAVRDALVQSTPGLDMSPGERTPLDLPVIDVGPWPEGLTLSREEIYGDDE